MRKSPAKVDEAAEALLRKQAALRVPILSVKEICEITGLHRNSVRNYFNRYAIEVQTHNADAAGEEAHSHE